MFFIGGNTYESDTPSSLIEKIKNYIPPKMENKWN